MKFDIVTSFHQAGYEEYGHNFIKTMDKYLPKEMKIYVYTENVTFTPPSDRIIIVDLLEVRGERLKAFEIIAKPYEETKKDISSGSRFLYEASRFARKYYAVEHAISNTDGTHLVWMDADIIADTSVPLQFFESLVHPSKYWSRINRGNMYPETGFMIWNKAHPAHKAFWNIMYALYDGGEAFKFAEWTDSYLFWMAERYINASGLEPIGFNLGDDRPGHAFVRGPLGQYFDHLKGKRKATGFSPERIKR